jgi:phospholipid/cholesterol/gamma-HCH transport system ATP-binding protein
MNCVGATHASPLQELTQLTSREETDIRMERVCYSIGGRIILEDFDLRLTKGVNRTILGVSGVGKTTILKLLLGLLQPDSGRIFIDGHPLEGVPEKKLIEMRKKIAIVFQGGALFDSMTVGENVGYRLFEEGKQTARQIEEIVLEKLSFVGLETSVDLYPAELSGGMKKRAAVARALAAEPDYIFLDEPTTGLDPIGVYNICHLILRLQKEGKTTLMVTHDLETAFAVSQRFSFIHEGRLVFEGTGDEMRAAEIQEVREFFRPAASSLFTDGMNLSENMPPMH